MKHWLAVCCKPRQELVAQENLIRQDFNAYLPRIQVQRRRRGQWVNVAEALFPRYLFIQVDPDRDSVAPVRSTRGVTGLVSFGGQLAVVADEVINAILQREDQNSGLHQDSRPLFPPGEPVKLVEGPLAGMKGIFDQEDGEVRATVLLELLGKTNKVKVNRNWIIRDA